MIALVTGGSGSGKSAFAEKLVLSLTGESYIYLATMQNYGDEETSRRIARHRDMRADKGFVTVEQSMDLSKADIPEGACVLLECLPNLVANEMFDGGDTQRILPALDALAARCASLVVVTDSVFSDGVTYDESTTAYLRCLAACAAHIAARADAVVEVVCGIPVPVKGALPCV